MSCARLIGMTMFFRRFIGALALDPATFEDVEHDRSAGLQSFLVLAIATAAGAVALLGLDMIRPAGFLAGLIIVSGALVVWVSAVTVVGVIALPERDTQSDMGELMRTFGFAAAPAVFMVFGAIESATPFIFLAVSLWVIAATVIAMRQALDYHSTVRAIAVCVLAWVLSLGTIAVIAAMFEGEAR